MVCVCVCHFVSVCLDKRDGERKYFYNRASLTKAPSRQRKRGVSGAGGGSIEEKENVI